MVLSFRWRPDRVEDDPRSCLRSRQNPRRGGWPPRARGRVIPGAGPVLMAASLLGHVVGAADRVPSTAATSPAVGRTVCPEFVLEWGEPGFGPGQFGGPIDIELDTRGDVYVLDASNGRIQKFTANGQLLKNWSVHPLATSLEATEERSQKARAMILLGERICVVRGRDISIYSIDGTLEDTWNLELEIGSPCPADDGGLLLLADRGSRVIHLSRSGEIIGGFAIPPDSSQPRGSHLWMQAAPGGSVYIVDEIDRRVRHYSNEGERLESWGRQGDAPGQVDSPAGLAVLPDGRILLSDRALHRVTVFGSDGRYLCHFGGRGTRPGEFDRPGRMAVGPLGIYVCDYMNARIQLFREPEMVRPPRVWPAVKKWLSSGLRSGAPTEAPH